MQLKVWENVSVSFSRLSLLESEVRRRCREVCPTGLPARNLIQLSHSFHSGEINQSHIFNTKPILSFYLNVLYVFKGLIAWLNKCFISVNDSLGFLSLINATSTRC